MAMRELIFRRGAHAFDRHVEIELLTRERMVAVDRDHVAGDVRDGDRARALIRLGLELHADVDIANALEGTTRNLLHERLVVLAVPFRGRELDAHRIARRFAFERALEARDQVAVAMQIRERFAACGTVDRLALIVGERVVDENDCVLRNLHGRECTVGVE